jgi:hypothetical protein
MAGEACVLLLNCQSKIRLLVKNSIYGLVHERNGVLLFGRATCRGGVGYLLRKALAHKTCGRETSVRNNNNNGGIQKINKGQAEKQATKIIDGTIAPRESAGARTCEGPRPTTAIIIYIERAIS